MMQKITGLLSKQEVALMQEKLSACHWIDGRVTTGAQGSQVKANQQVDTGSAEWQELQQYLLTRLNSHPQFFSATLPVNISSPLFNRYTDGGTYGFHVDGAVRREGNDWLRTDISATLFLSEPDSYQGGELIIRDTYGQHSVKLPAGDMILYPSSSLHCVTPVTEGERLASFMWIQSMIRDDKKRAMLISLDENIQTLNQQPQSADVSMSLLNLYHNLLREWSGQ
ncbi:MULTISPECIES: Fe2+-dependent dioxygenase [Tatumella]|uniref:Fe2+-dependent dioxygenase n=1 Tax=Tatumella punctata TaxID=399969 RepID=A0ABW1VL16_9GAMM|nr:MULTISPECIES: Fe2+-dependent dioxygenase [unclassified Tatumella]MBS0855229.1 Fe2+-dependent dioxygenase [Tatumella sp. JGM16]MBS0876781.1 Fe2+-dependent dioxygenase [Tatumella sp. JGM82]MBS0889794.1 Fe2+-dependent dioxygenase [Tatumella sp. JGM94]MBS0901536.1 Fe2+-dependent dioxygenase [Tatumella sp. JGM100]MBS0911786.1 Fe2+-dependent dioxygenase [Tatumella sp. JGM91]